MQIGLDLGGTKCLGVALEVASGKPLRILAEHRLATPEGSEAIIDTLVEVVLEVVESAVNSGTVAEAVRGATVLGPIEIAVGAGVPGLITREGVMRASPNLPGMYEVNIAAQLAERLAARFKTGCATGRSELLLSRVIVDNDANCAALAEWAYGAGAGAQDLLLVTLGTGIGGGMVIGGRPYRGRHGFAGEFGHMVIEPLGLLCPCGQRGCWERYGSGSGLAQLGQEAAMTSPMGHGQPLRAEDVVAAVRAGSGLAIQVMESFAKWVALGLVNLANILDPEIIIIGGGLASEAELFLPEVKRLFAELLYETSHRDHPVIAIAQSDHRAGAIGAAVAASLPA